MKAAQAATRRPSGTSRRAETTCCGEVSSAIVIGSQPKRISMLACPRRPGGHLRVRRSRNPKTRLVRKNQTFVVNLSDIYCNHRAVDALSHGIQRCSLPCHRSQLAGAETPVILTGVSFQGGGSA